MLFSGKVVANPPAYRPRPAQLPESVEFSDEGSVAWVTKSALAAIRSEALRVAPQEAIGYLVGRPFRDKQGHYVLITGALCANEAKRGLAAVQTTLSDEQEAARAIERDFSTAERVGWWHSHPFDLPHYSATDFENQRVWCSKSYELGLLACVDGTRVNIHAFSGPDGRRLPQVHSARPPVFDSEQPTVPPTITVAPAPSETGPLVSFGSIAVLALVIAVICSVTAMRQAGLRADLNMETAELQRRYRELTDRLEALEQRRYPPPALTAPSTSPASPMNDEGSDELDH